MAKKYREIHLRVDEDLYEALTVQANKRGKPTAQLAREILRKNVTAQSAVEGLDVIEEVVRDTMTNILKRTEDRMAKLAAKAAIAAATSMYANIQCIEDLGSSDAVSVFEKARKKAIAYVKTPENSEGGD